MQRFLMLRLDGPMQAWGTHSLEDFRPSNLFPTRSGLLGLLGACLGIDRGDKDNLERLGASIEFAVRVDPVAIRLDAGQVAKSAVKLVDFHTVLDARKVDGSVNKHPVVSRREYLHDAVFTVAVGQRADAEFTLEEIADAVQRPCYTPVLGRRSCPPSLPLFSGWQEEMDAKAALDAVPPYGGVIYAEGQVLTNDRPMQVRDVPTHGRHRSFATRKVYVHVPQEK